MAIFNMVGSGGGGGSGITLTITAPAGCTVTINKDNESQTKTANADGLAVFMGLTIGDWTLTAVKDDKTVTKTVTVTADCFVAIDFSTIPDFTYTGDFKITDDSGNQISTAYEYDNWQIRFLTSGTLTFTTLNGAENGVDVFCVGGGGGGQKNEESGYGDVLSGGGGGYTKTTKNVAVKKGESYQIVIGAGGAGLNYVKMGSYGNDGGATTAFGCTAKGGYAAYAGLGFLPGGNGGSGGGGGGPDDNSTGGSDGSNGEGAKDTDIYGNGIPFNNRGKGQGTTTRAFGEQNGELFAGGGGSGTGSGGAGGGGDAWKAGTVNTGGGGGCCASGGSGIVIIRNKRG